MDGAHHHHGGGGGDHILFAALLAVFAPGAVGALLSTVASIVHVLLWVAGLELVSVALFIGYRVWYLTRPAQPSQAPPPVQLWASRVADVPAPAAPVGALPPGVARALPAASQSVGLHLSGNISPEAAAAAVRAMRGR